MFLVHPLKKNVMNKLLLLATILVSLLLKDYAAATPIKGANQSDTADVELLKANPKTDLKTFLKMPLKAIFN